VLRPRQTSETDLAVLLGHLPEDYLVAPLRSAWFVVGAPGTYVVGDDSTNDDGAIGRLAVQIRAALAQHLTWVPFVHALLVSEELRAIPQAIIVPPDMLLGVLTEGRRSLDEDTVQRIGELIGRGIIARVAPPVEDAEGAARMPPCDPSPLLQEPTSSSTSSEAPAIPSSSPMPPGSTDGSGNPSPPD
jgi:hypothetical protein